MSEAKSVDPGKHKPASPADGPFKLPFKSPVQPVELTLDSTIQFQCHKGIACFNECCRNIDITLMPYDILRLKKRFDMTAGEFVGRYTVPFEMDSHGMPGLKILTKPGTTECVFLTEDGCSVYEDRPVACRYYALGSMGVRKKESDKVEDIYFVVKEPHCLGHDEPRALTVREYRKEQGIEKYDTMNREWRDVVIKKRSSGPTIGKPTERSMQLFDMCSYDMDSFREFIHTESFHEVFDIDEQTMSCIKTDDEALMQFAFRFLKQVFFGNMTIPVKEDAKEKRLAKRHELRAKRKARESRGQTR